MEDQAVIVPAPETPKEKFLSLCKSIERPGIRAMLSWLDKTDFYQAPASRAYHGSYTGGLLEHSLNVYNEMRRMVRAYASELSGYFSCISPEGNVEDSIKIISLFHDLCKVHFYTTEKRNRKNEHGQWESYDAFAINEAFRFGGHGSKSVYIIQNFMKLTPEEATAINCHMGAFGEDPKSVGSAFESCPLAWLLSVADQSATYVVEGFNKNKADIWKRRQEWMDGFDTDRKEDTGERETREE